jgi:uncharacterized repeat protein (TIGR01451 family)
MSSVFLLAAAPAHAGVGGSAVPTAALLPANIGTTFGASIIYTNDSDAGNIGDLISLVNLFVTPSCASGIGVCSPGSEELGVFQLSATASGAALGSCQGVGFTFGAPNVTTGEVAIIPVTSTLGGNMTNVQTTLTLSSATGFPTNASAHYVIQVDSEQMEVTGGQGTTTLTVVRGINSTSAAAHSTGATVTQFVSVGSADSTKGPFVCEIDFQMTVLKKPVGDSSGDLGKQTDTLTRAGFRRANDSPVTTSGSATSTIIGPDLTISKSPVGGSITAGQNAVFTITVSNNGANASASANSVVISDQLPNTLSWSLTPAVTGCSIDGNQLLTCTLPGPIAIGGSVNIVVTAATSSDSCPASILNVANITGTNGQVFVQGIASNQASISCSQIIANLQATKTDGQSTYTPGNQVVYTITVSNPSGPSAATGAIVSDTKPAQITTWSWVCQSQTGGASGCDGSGGQVSTSPFTDTVNLPVGGVITYVVTANTDPSATGSLVNTVTVTPTQGQAGTATDTDTIAPVSNLVISKTNGGSTVVFGGTTTYSITVVNNGPSTATGAILSDPSVSGLSKTSVSCAPSPGVCVSPPSIGQLEGGSFALPAMTPGQTYVLTVQATVTSVTGSITNSASITPPGGTTTTGSGCTTSGGIVRSFSNPTCTSSDTDTVQYFSLSVQKSASTNTATPGSQVTFTVSVHNNGPAAADGTVVTDILPNGFTGSTAVCSSGPSCPGGDLLSSLNGAGVTLSSFPSGATYNFVITGTFTLSSGGLINTGTACPPQNLSGQVQCGNGQTTVQVPNPDIAIPTLGEYGMILLMLMMAGLGAATVRQRRR